MSPLAILSGLFGALKFVKIIANMGKILRFAKASGSIVKSIAEKKSFPACGESKDFLKAAAELIRTGIIDIPGVDEESIAKAIDEVEKEIECKAA